MKNILLLILVASISFTQCKTAEKKNEKTVTITGIYMHRDKTVAYGKAKENAIEKAKEFIGEEAAVKLRYRQPNKVQYSKRPKKYGGIEVIVKVTYIVSVKKR